jgi:hypothetical protein
MIGWRRLSVLIGVLLVVAALGACGGDDDPDPTVTSAPEATAVVDSPATQSSDPIVGSTATDGICQVTIPDTWFDDGTGRGATEQGDRWSVFGNTISSDEAWTTAKDLLKSQFSTREGVTITEEDRIIIAEMANGRGYVVRERFNDRYCDFSVTANVDRPDEVTAIWIDVSDTLGPVRAE